VRGVEPRETGLESVCSPRSTPLCFLVERREARVES